MKKNIILTTVLGFIVGLILSGMIFDLITVIGKSFTRISVARTVSKAEKAYSNGRFSDSVLYYENALAKINPESQKLLAKTKNNYALALINLSEQTKNTDLLKKASEMLADAYNLYIELRDRESVDQTSKNILILNDMISAAD